MFLRVPSRACLPCLMFKLIVAVLVLIDFHHLPRSTREFHIFQAIFADELLNCWQLRQREIRLLGVIVITLELHREDIFLHGSHLSNFVAVKADLWHYSLNLVYFWNCV
jgi:hypothetical protein